MSWSRQTLTLILVPTTCVGPLRHLAVCLFTCWTSEVETAAITHCSACFASLSEEAAALCKLGLFVGYTALALAELPIPLSPAVAGSKSKILQMLAFPKFGTESVCPLLVFRQRRAYAHSTISRGFGSLFFHQSVWFQAQRSCRRWSFL